MCGGLGTVAAWSFGRAATHFHVVIFRSDGYDGFLCLGSHAVIGGNLHRAYAILHVITAVCVHFLGGFKKLCDSTSAYTIGNISAQCDWIKHGDNIVAQGHRFEICHVLPQSVYIEDRIGVTVSIIRLTQPIRCLGGLVVRPGCEPFAWSSRFSPGP